MISNFDRGVPGIPGFFRILQIFDNFADFYPKTLINKKVTLLSYYMLKHP